MDYFSIWVSLTTRYVYVVQKISSYYAGGSNYQTFGFLRQKHFLQNSMTVYLLKNPNFETVACTVSQSWITTNRMADYYGAMTMTAIDIKDRTRSASTWHYLSVYMGTVSTNNLDSAGQAGIVVVVKFESGRPYSSMSGSTSYCNVESGVTSTDRLHPVYCELDGGNHQLIIRNVNKFSDNTLRVHYYATNLNAEQGSTVVSVRAYANADSYATSGGWQLFYGTTTNSVTLPANVVYSGTNSNQNAPNYAGTDYNMMPSSWINSGYSQVLGVTSTHIVIRCYSSSTMTFSNVYWMQFLFTVPRLSFSGNPSVSFSSNRYSSNHRGLSYSSVSGSQFRIGFQYMSTGNPNWPTWYSGDYYDFTLTFSSITGDYLSSPQPTMIGVTTSIFYAVQIYYSSNLGMCGCAGTCCNGYCCNDCCNDGCCCSTYCCSSYCCSYNSCYYYYNWGSFIFVDSSTSASPNLNLASSAAVDLISTQASVETELSVDLNSLNTPLGTDGSFLLLHLSGQAYPNSNPFPATRYQDEAAYIDCMCQVNSGSYSEPVCVRLLVSGMDPAIAVFVSASVSQSVTCYFPGYLASSNGASTQVDFSKKFTYSFQKYLPNYYAGLYVMQDLTVGYQGSGTSGSFSVSFPTNFWTTTYEAYQSVSYDSNISSSVSVSSPTVYMAMYYPQPTASFCNSGFSVCRVYTSFVNRRYFVVATYSGTTSVVRFSSTIKVAPADDASAGFYNVYVAYGTNSGNRYYGIYSATLGNSYVSGATPTYSYSTGLYGSNLFGLPSQLVISANLAGVSLYNWRTDYGQFQGSYIKFTLTGLTSLYGCGATLSNRPYSFTAPLFCLAVSSTVVQVYAKADIAITGTLYITLYTSSMPSSLTYRMQLYDKYISGSDYSIGVDITQSFSRSPPNTLVQSTSILWRRQAFKMLSSTSGPKRVIFNNNFQYVYDTDTPALSDAIVLTFPTGISNSYTYHCKAYEYLPNQRHLYTEYELPCVYFAANAIRITALASHILQPTYFYELAIYRNNNGANAYLTADTGAYQLIVESIDALSSYTVVNRDYIQAYQYQAVYPIVLNSIYTLTWQAGVLNSLYLDLTVSATTSAFQYLEFVFPALGLSSFEIDNGEQIPCYISSQITQASGKSQAPFCRGYTDGLSNDSPLVIRVLNINPFSTGSTQFKIAFDNFNNPPVQQYSAVAMDVRVSLIDSTNNKVFSSYFPAVYFSQNSNLAAASALGGTLSGSNMNRGASTYQYFAISWPYTSSVSDTSQKIVLKVQGGLTCCNPFSSFSLNDNVTTSYSLLWTDSVANISVYQTPTHSSGLSTRLNINNVVNPYPYQFDTYNQLLLINVLMYSNYANTYLQQFSQLDYSSYNQLSQLSVQSGLGSSVDATRSYSFHPGYPMTYDISYSFTLSAFPNRQLDYTLLSFTAGVASIE